MQHTHIIRRQRFRVKTDSESLAFNVRKIINEKLNDEIIPQIEETLNTNFNNSDVVLIDKLKINLGSLSVEYFQNNFSQLIAMQLKEEIENQLRFDVSESKNDSDKKPNITVTSHLNQKADALIYFLEHGIFPWWFYTDASFSIEVLIEDVLNNKTEVITSYILQTATEKGISRLTSQLSEQQLHKLFLILSEQTNLQSEIRNIISAENKFRLVLNLPENKTRTILLRALIGAINSNEDKQEFTFISKIAEMIQDEIQSKEIVTEIFERLKKENIINELSLNAAINTTEIKIESNLSGKKIKPEKSNAVNDDGIHIKNAGLIILHPFLEILFSEFHLLNKEKHFENESCKQKALHVLNYLISGRTEIEEWNVAFLKIILSMEMEEVIDNSIQLSEAEKEECDKLLQQVIEYWAALKNSSIAALRENFFNRGGKLTITEEKILIQIERQTIDILLERLPWGLSIISFPWLNKMIYAEW